MGMIIDVVVIAIPAIVVLIAGASSLKRRGRGAGLLGSVPRLGIGTMGLLLAIASCVLPCVGADARLYVSLLSGSIAFWTAAMLLLPPGRLTRAAASTGVVARLGMRALWWLSVVWVSGLLLAGLDFLVAWLRGAPPLLWGHLW